MNQEGDNQKGPTSEVGEALESYILAYILASSRLKEPLNKQRVEPNVAGACGSLTTTEIEARV